MKQQEKFLREQIFFTVLELCSPKQRSYMGSWNGIPWALGYVSVSGICYLVRPWRYLQAALVAPIILHIPNYW